MLFVLSFYLFSILGLPGFPKGPNFVCIYHLDSLLFSNPIMALIKGKDFGVKDKPGINLDFCHLLAV